MHFHQPARSYCLVSLALCLSNLVAGHSHYSSPVSAEEGPVVTTCPGRTINYITQTLPKLCLTSAWTSSTPPARSAGISQDGGSYDTGSAPDIQYDTSHDPPLHPAAAESSTHPEEIAAEPVSTPFMSFEDWKEMMIRQTGQDPHDLRHRQPIRDRAPPDSVNAGLGEEDEISLNFDGYIRDMENHGESIDDSLAENGPPYQVEETVAFDDGRPSVHRSKDAGKTCKERFSYSSFDAGATVLKSSPGAKNAKAILVENKDSYMLLECSAKNKFVIVELSDDILIDTIVLANFEFFSSMIRHFRISVSDRYPVKTERWKELGHFEARNSRDIQPFLVENPQIWAKYVRVEFLTHYGNEYYCPVSLLRVHGSRMLDSWKDSEAGRDDEGHIEDHPEQANDHTEALDAKAHSSEELVEPEPSTVVLPSPAASLQCPFEPKPNVLQMDTSMCKANLEINQELNATKKSEAHTQEVEEIINSEGNFTKQGEEQLSRHVHHSYSTSSILGDTATPTTMSYPNTPSTVTTTLGDDVTSHTNVSVESSVTTSRSSVSTTNLTPVNSKPASQHGSVGKNRTSATTTASAASPTIQEGFFKAITKRLQQVETNLTLSLKYVEDHARHVQDTLQKNENKQTSKVAIFLENLNQTVLAELRSVREQYDEIWQSTVIALESQREQSGREIVALSTRLNLLADEVIFQKRMAIVQAVLLLSCLLLVIFSRGVSIPSFVPVLEQTEDDPFGTPNPHSFQPRVVYRPELEIPKDSKAVFDCQQHMDYRPVAMAPQEVPANDGLPRSQDCLGQPTATIRQYQRLSPPLTPGNLDSSTDSNNTLSSHDPISIPFRSVTSQQQTTTRKPLPALPENPSSP